MSYEAEPIATPPQTRLEIRTMNDNFKNLSEAAASIQKPHHRPLPTLWTGAAEDALILVAEAHRRFLVMTQNPSHANSLTIAWTMAYAAQTQGGD